MQPVEIVKAVKAASTGLGAGIDSLLKYSNMKFISVISEIFTVDHSWPVSLSNSQSSLGLRMKHQAEISQPVNSA